MSNDPIDRPQSKPDDAAYAAALRETLRASEQTLDFNVTSRLRAARARAVEASRKPGLAWWPWSAAVPGACAAALAAWMILPQVFTTSPPPSAQAAQIEVLEVLGADEPPLSDEDIDFAQWLEDAHGSS